MKPNRFPGLWATLIVIAVAAPVTAQPVPSVDKVGKPAQIQCTVSASGAPIFAAHADKIIFKLTGSLVAVDPAKQAALDAIPRDSELDIKVLDNPTTVADLKGKVLTFLGAVDNAAARQAVVIIDVDYAMVCPVKPATT
jgi:hypothetical protein